MVYFSITDIFCITLFFNKKMLIEFFIIENYPREPFKQVRISLHTMLKKLSFKIAIEVS